jgi:putative tryptophan/tyrosine transport system substrate-binding protein
MRIRMFIAQIALAFTLPSLVALADPAKIGILGPAPPPVLAAMGDAIAGRLAQQGLVRDRDFTFETRSAEGKVERLPSLAKELVDAHVAVIVTRSYPAARAAKDATPSMPLLRIMRASRSKPGSPRVLPIPAGT